MARFPVRPGVPSENGWPMCNSNECVSVQVVPAAKKVPLRKGDVATILNAFLIAYNQRVEPIVSQVWGWSPDNDVANSNHMSGTAVDINAPKYPWGKKVMPYDRVLKVEALLRDFRGVVAWGRNWAYPDEMHFQIGLPPGDSRVKQLAADLNNGYLKIYSGGTAKSEEGKPMGLEKSQDARLNAVVQQLTGSIDPDVEGYKGWPQLGGRTLVDAVAAIGTKLEIPGFSDVKAA